MTAFRTLLLAHHATEGHVATLAVKQFAERVHERSDGHLSVATMPNSTLGSLPELFKMVLEGKTDMALPPHDRISAWCPRFGCVSLPFIFDDYSHADRVLNGDFNTWATPELEALGLCLLGNWEWGFRQITNSQRRILHPRDLKGLRVRVPPVLNCQAAMQALGAAPVVVEYAQLTEALKLGLIDGQENPVSVIHALRLDRWHGYLSIINYNYATAVHVINRKTFYSLPPAHQIILRQESERAGAFMRQALRAEEAQQLAELIAEGVKVDRPKVAPFKARMGPAYAKLSSVYGKHNVADFRSMVERYRSAA